MNTGINIEILEQTSDSLKFNVENIDVSLANSLRRIMISEVPCMAIELVKIINNTSCLNDEYIAHRLGLIPLLSARVDEFQFTQDCPCKPGDPCNQCKVEFTLKRKCP